MTIIFFVLLSCVFTVSLVVPLSAYVAAHRLDLAWYAIEDGETALQERINALKRMFEKTAQTLALQWLAVVVVISISLDFSSLDGFRADAPAILFLLAAIGLVRRQILTYLAARADVRAFERETGRDIALDSACVLGTSAARS